jgi:hypothetical protein
VKIPKCNEKWRVKVGDRNYAVFIYRKDCDKTFVGK